MIMGIAVSGAYRAGSRTQTQASQRETPVFGIVHDEVVVGIIVSGVVS